MVQYVEFLRAKRALIVVAIVLAVLLAAAIVVRLIAFKAADPQVWVADMQNSSTAHVSTQQLPDGSTRTVIDDPAKHTHAVIVRKDGGFRMDIDEPSSSERSRNSDTVIGSIDIRENRKSGMAHVTISSGHHSAIPLSMLFLISIPIGLLTATMLGGALAKENDGHLELAWTKPASRERMAMQAIGIDAAAIVISQILAVAVYLCCILLFHAPAFTAGDGPLFAVILLAFVAPVAWYAALTAWSASLKSHLGMVIGLGWPAALIVPGIAHATRNVGGLVGHAVHVVFSALSYIDPIAYMSFGSNAQKLIASIEGTLLALVLLTAVYIATSVLQWRRVEA